MTTISQNIDTAREVAEQALADIIIVRARKIRFGYKKQRINHIVYPC